MLFTCGALVAEGTLTVGGLVAFSARSGRCLPACIPLARCGEKGSVEEGIGL